MCELLVRVVDKVNPDFYLNTQCTKRGDVISVQPDGCVWGTEELANPEWRILRVPDLTVSDAAVFLAPEISTDPTQPSKTLQRRAFKLDLDHPAVTAAGLRAFFDEHHVVAVETPSPVVEHVRSAIETLNSAGEVIQVERPRRTIVRHAVHHLAADRRAQLGAIPFVGPTLRTHCIAHVDAALVASLHTAKPPIPDPAILGPSPLVIG